MPGTIKFLGGVALLVSGLTGPSIAVIPQLFQQAGWFTPVMAFLLTTVLVGSASLFLVESMSSIAGNEGFQASIEFSTLAELFLGNRWHWAFQIILYIALHSQTITSLIESFQSMDTLLVTIAHKSCAISFQKGWECVDTLLPNGAGVFSDYIFLSFGYLMTFVLVLPLGLIHLSDNIKFQIASLTTLFVIVIIWIVTFFQVGITNHPIPTIGSNQGTVVGYVISNFAIVTTIPAFVNNIHPSTNIHRVVWLSLLISCVLYLMIGLTGASAFNTPQNSTILDVISARRPSIIALISVYVFPLAVLITSIPVFMIVIRYNLLRGNICSKPWAIFLLSVLPWIIVIPFQTNGWLTVIMNWASLFFSSTANLIIPFILYLVSKRYHASAVLDIQLDQDEFRLRPLEISSLNNSSVSIHRHSGSQSVVAIHSRSRSQISHEQHAEDPLVSTIINSTEKLASPGHFFDAETTTSTSAHPDNTIRLVRSPSVHRYYGEAIEGSSTGHGPRRPSISRSVTPSLAFGRTEHEKVDLKPGTEVDGATKQPEISPMSDVLLVLPPESGSVGTASSAVSMRSGAEGDAPTIHSSSWLTSRVVPKIKIDTTTLTDPSEKDSLSMNGAVDQNIFLSSPSHMSLHGLRPSFEQVRRRASVVQRLPSPQDMDDVSAARDPEGQGGGGLSLPFDPMTGTGAPPTSLFSNSTSNHEISHPAFQAFPRFDNKPWFNSTKVAIIFCTITTVMIIVAVVYNIVLTARQKS